MLLKIEKLHKSIGLKDLFENLNLIVNKGEKIGLIGRNGLGKTTLVRILNGEDIEYQGEIEVKKGISVVMTRQEHYLSDDITVLDYVLDSIPRYRELLNCIRSYESKGSEEVSLEEYCDAINDFSHNDYYSVENRIIQSFIDFQLDEEKILNPMNLLSGGEKRFMELVRVMYSGADLALIDEPTNHMDYIGKERFIKWLNEIDKTIIVITHDRDVLNNVTRIVELKDLKLYSFNGNYDHYIQQNNIGTVTGIESYESGLKQADKLKKQMIAARDAKLRAKGNKGRIQAKIREERFTKELKKVESNLQKPSFWIDQESLENISERIVDKYEKYKEKNINITHKSSVMHKKLLINVKRISVGYEKPLFENINFDLFYGDKIFIKGRNGAGKSTFVKTILSIAKHTDTKSKIFSGDVKVSSSLKIGVYEQEIDRRYLNMTLEEAIMDLYYINDLPVNKEKINAVLKNYLFDPLTDSKLTFDKLSGGQKARFQLIKMFINEPNLLILDEPTNHLDLPSIEELENALKSYHGGIIYISHDSYFVKNIGGNVIEIEKR